MSHSEPHVDLIFKVSGERFPNFLETSEVSPCRGNPSRGCPSRADTQVRPYESVFFRM